MRYKISKSHSKRAFRAGANHTKAINFRQFNMRGGIRL